MTRGLVLLAGALVAASWGSVVIGRMQSPSTSDGVYTEAQAAKGQELYAQACENCHQPAKFTGAEFTRAYVGKPLAELDRSMAEMPMDNPGSLTGEDVASLIAFILQMNKYPAGQTPLSVDAFTGITIAPRP